MLLERTLPYWNDVIVPEMKAGKKILIAAHGNSLRCGIRIMPTLYHDKYNQVKRNVYASHVFAKS